MFRIEYGWKMMGTITKLNNTNGDEERKQMSLTLELLAPSVSS